MDMLPGEQLIRPVSGLTNSSADWASQLLGDHENIQTYAPYVRQAYSYLSVFISISKWWGAQVMDQVYKKPDLATILMLVTILFISLKVFNMLWQMVISWVKLVLKIVLWGGMALLAVWMYTRGPEGFMEDVEYWWQTWSQKRADSIQRQKAAIMAEQKNFAANRGWFETYRD